MYFVLAKDFCRWEIVCAFDDEADAIYEVSNLELSSHKMFKIVHLCGVEVSAE